MVYPALLPLMRTPRLPVVDWTDAPADSDRLIRLAERRYLVSARVPSHLKRSLIQYHSSILSKCNTSITQARHNGDNPETVGRPTVNYMKFCCCVVVLLLLLLWLSPSLLLLSYNLYHHHHHYHHLHLLPLHLTFYRVLRGENYFQRTG